MSRIKAPHVGDSVIMITPIEQVTEHGEVTELLSEQFVYKNDLDWERIVRYDDVNWRLDV